MLVTALALVHAAPLEARWDLSEGTSHRWAVETHIDFPGHVLLQADRNANVRARSLGLEAVLDCTTRDGRGRRARLDCTIETASTSGATFPSDEARLQPVLEELSQKLTDATVQITLSETGQVRDVDLSPTPVSTFENRRTRETEALLRMLVVRALAPLDHQIPQDGFPTDRPWSNSSQLTAGLPVTHGSAGVSRIQHSAVPHDDTRILVRSSGYATVVPAGFQEPNGLVLKADIEGFTVFDTDAGRISEAVWSTVADPTPSSGPLARRYAATSRLRALDPDET